MVWDVFTSVFWSRLCRTGISSSSNVQQSSQAKPSGPGDSESLKIANSTTSTVTGLLKVYFITVSGGTWCLWSTGPSIWVAARVRGRRWCSITLLVPAGSAGAPESFLMLVVCASLHFLLLSKLVLLVFSKNRSVSCWFPWLFFRFHFIDFCSQLPFPSLCFGSVSLFISGCLSCELRLLPWDFTSFQVFSIQVLYMLC